MIVKKYSDNRIILIASKNKKDFIGKENTLIHNSKEDLNFFKKKTDGHVVIMGRKTFDSIGKPLKNRINIVISNKMTQKEALKKGVFLVNHPTDAIILAHSLIREFKDIHNYRQDIFIIGGANIYGKLMKYSDEIILNVFKDNNVEGDVKFPNITDNFNLKYKKYHKDFIEYNYKANHLIKVK